MTWLSRNPVRYCTHTQRHKRTHDSTYTHTHTLYLCVYIRTHSSCAHTYALALSVCAYAHTLAVHIRTHTLYLCVHTHTLYVCDLTHTLYHTLHTLQRHTLYNHCKDTHSISLSASPNSSLVVQRGRERERHAYTLPNSLLVSLLVSLYL